jgi:hypothetical protein
MLRKSLLPFSLVSNFATLLGLWITYEAAPASVQAKIGHWLILLGAAASIIGYIAFALFVMRPKAAELVQPINPEAAVARPRMDAMARKNGIYIGPAGIAMQLIGEDLSIRLSIFTCTMIELRYIRVMLTVPGMPGSR